MKTYEEILSRCTKNGSCIEYKHSLNPAGYGNVRFNGDRRLANRVVYQLTKGEIPEGLFVCHSCDNPSCINPEHLWLGTHKENMRDRDRKGRVFHGEKHNFAKLKEKEVKEIRELFKKSKSMASLSKKYGVAIISIERIVNFQTWKEYKND